ncbi:hypothetical protein TRAPUB_14116 [Trametes pubescens]|uniref:Uncharacterized protein n=1 Tax=Trametes pubescens TaxID=154538 RepID=A0A1M2VPA8_TRAPU|nr:hypothetical protein TRAPUB_14116 [Trametes pubescens]
MSYVEIDIVDLNHERGKPTRRICPLTGPDLQDQPGSLEYTFRYCSKFPPNKGLPTDGSDPNLPDDLRERLESKDARAVMLNDLEMVGKEHTGEHHEGEKGQDNGKEGSEPAVKSVTDG